MKTRLFFALLCVLSVAFSAGAQPTPPSYFVVIGAFAIQENAGRHVADAAIKGLTPTPAINPLRKLTYVYTLQTDHARAAFAEAARIRQSTPYKDTWVFFGRLGETQPQIPLAREEKSTPEAAIPAREEKAIATLTPPPDSASVIPAKKDTRPARKPEDGKDFLFQVMSGTEPLKGVVDIYDKDKKRKLRTLNSNEQTLVKPLTPNGQWIIVCEIMGYKPKEFTLNYFEPGSTAGVEVTEAGEVLVSIDLQKAVRGDMLRTYHVRFFEDASVMRPESQDEVDALKQMLQDNPEFRIRIHGHTNGNYGGKIVSKKEDDREFFMLTNTQEGKGSAKKLSGMRAEAIRTYLIASGIQATRMEIEAWGGKKPLEDPYGDKAAANSRVEIEIL